MNYIDLHVHSTASDGTFTPSEVIRYAAKKKLKAIALTDHDTTAGIEEARKTAKELSVQFIPGIELSAVYKGKDIHILGLFIDEKNKAFQNAIESFKKSREERNLKMIKLLADSGFDISSSKLKKEFGDAVLTRAHFARYLLNRQYISTMKEAFDKYIGPGCPCYLPKPLITPEESIRIILNANGLPILAHPLLYHLSIEEIDELLVYLKKLGLVGLEAIYSSNTGNDENEMRHLANIHGLILSGGSDFHGTNKPQIDLGTGKGNLKIPYELVEKMQALIASSVSSLKD
jgi:predicted metal-dependent phosphoesterase TrpH